MQVQVKRENEYVPDLAKLVKKTKMTEEETLFEFVFEDDSVRDLFTYNPGQFVQVSIFGIGEAPFSISSTPTRPGVLQLGIRNTGDVTAAIHKLEVGAKVGIRGPYGNGFPMDKMRGRNLLFVAGGLGLVPLRSVINYVADNREDFGKVTIFYGTNSPERRLFVDEFENTWPKVPDFELHQTVDRGNESWHGNVGVVTTLFNKCEVDSTNSTALICGPPVVYKFVTRDLLKLGFYRCEIYLSLERKMKCGIGKCAHCQVGHKLACIDGPVFTYFEAERLQESI
ncbi:MAG: FAD/NAD(P)-binding protein [Candidatus Thorarchaeota archaeon]|jgi:NAD(P)H-flavin reductase